MEISKETPREDMGIQGVILSIAQPFSKGHKCTQNEAATLNQILKENVRNNQAPTIKKMDEDKKSKNEMQKLIDEYVNGYEFGVRRSGGTKDPVEAEAISLAKEKVKAAILKGGTKLSSVKAADITAKAVSLIDQYPQFREKAKKIVAERKLDIAGLDVAM